MRGEFLMKAKLWATAATAALAAACAPAAFAQESLNGALAAGTGFGDDDAVSDAVEDIREDVQDDFDRDIGRFGNEGRELGFQGSVAPRATATSGNSESSDLGIAAGLEYFDGLNGSDLSFAYTYSDDGDDGDDPEENLYISTSYTRELGRDIFGYARGVAIYDNNQLDTGGDDNETGDSDYRSDIFVGVGLGYRIANSEQFQWSVQAGPGYRWYEPFGEDDPTTAGDDTERVDEFAGSVTSNLLYQFTPTVFVTNDTDVIASDATTSVLNDLALNVALNESLSLRTSLLTEYQSDPGQSFNEDTGLFEEADNYDNTLGVAVVYSF
jgi:putative salt-induced outer membrane protein